MKRENKFKTRKNVKEVVFEPIPNSVRIRPTSGKGTYSYATILFRKRVEYKDGSMDQEIYESAPLYLHLNPDLQLAFQVAIPALASIQSNLAKRGAYEARMYVPQ